MPLLLSGQEEEVGRFLLIGSLPATLFAEAAALGAAKDSQSAPSALLCILCRFLLGLAFYAGCTTPPPPSDTHTHTHTHVHPSNIIPQPHTHTQTTPLLYSPPQAQTQTHIHPCTVIPQPHTLKHVYIKTVSHIHTNTEKHIHTNTTQTHTNKQTNKQTDTHTHCNELNISNTQAQIKPLPLPLQDYFS